MNEWPQTCSADDYAKKYLSEERRRQRAASRCDYDRDHDRDRDDAHDLGWTIVEGASGLTVAGRGVVAAKEYEAGDVIFVDTALMFAPRVAVRGNSPLCSVCYAAAAAAALVPCPRGCGLPVCRERCADRPEHREDCDYVRRLGPKIDDGRGWSLGVYNALAAVRSVSLKKSRYRHFLDVLQKKSANKPVFEVEELKRNTNLKLDEEDEQIMITTCKIMDANCFETITNRDGCSISLRGLYPVAAFMNHSCVPNTMHNFDETLQMIVKATLPINKGQEISTSYTHLIWPTSLRQHHLVTSKEFVCTCNRCCDAEEFGTKLAALNCTVKNCCGRILPINPLHKTSIWQCKVCTKLVSSEEMLSLYRDVEKLMRSINLFCPRSLETILKTFNIHKDSSFLVDLKVKFIWKSKNNDLTLGQLLYKEKSCTEILNLLQKLGLGQCRLLGLISQELLKVIKEKCDRFHWDIKTLNIFEQQMNKLKEVSTIVLDVNAN